MVEEAACKPMRNDRIEHSVGRFLHEDRCDVLNMFGGHCLGSPGCCPVAIRAFLLLTDLTATSHLLRLSARLHLIISHLIPFPSLCRMYLSRLLLACIPCSRLLHADNEVMHLVANVAATAEEYGLSQTAQKSNSNTLVIPDGRYHLDPSSREPNIHQARCVRERHNAQKGPCN